jgi:ribonucleoside-diphosphate reductase alpha chain
LFPDGRPGELFVKIAKEGSTLSGLADAIGVLASLALQYGVPVEALAKKFEYMRFEPSGWTKNGEIPRAHSIVDYIFRWMGLQFSAEYRAQSQNHSDDSSVTS